MNYLWDIITLGTIDYQKLIKYHSQFFFSTKSIINKF